MARPSGNPLVASTSSPRNATGNYLHEKYLTENCGIFRSLVVEYLEGFATLPNYRNQRNSTRSLGPFFLFLTNEGITSLEQVEPALLRSTSPGVRRPV